VSDGSSRTVVRTVVVSLVLALAVMWIYVLFVANPESTEDKLKSPAFGQAAEPICKSTINELGRLGLVNQHTPTPQARAALVDRTGAELKAMVARLRSLVPRDADDAHAVTAWLADWDQWLADYGGWAEQLHRGENVQFFEKQRANGAPNSKALNEFAQINSMPSCATPGGV